MNIGIVYQSGNSLLGLIEIPFMTRQNFLILKNENKANDKAPDFNAMVRVAGNFTQLGGIWNKIANNEKRTQYKDLTIEHPFVGKIYLKMFVAKEDEVYKDSKEVDRKVLYNIVYSAPTKREDDNQFATAQTQYRQQEQDHNGIPVVHVDAGEEDEIPF